MGQAISKLTIKGYKSIRNLEDFELRKINILIGPNGSGKSNFVSFFNLLKAFAQGRLNVFVEQYGGANNLLYLGSKMTDKLIGEIIFRDGNIKWKIELSSSVKDTLILHREDSQAGNRALSSIVSLSREITKSRLNMRSSDEESREYEEAIAISVKDSLEAMTVYHFHDTSDFAKVKLPCLKQDYERLRSDGGNLAAFLLRLKSEYPKEYDFIKETVQLAAPFFEDFILKDHYSDSNKTLLEWKQKGSDDYPFQPSQISDGTLRFICLATALLQPNPPSTIIVDEPELGLHPLALALLAELIKKAALKTQVIVATQSAGLISQLDPQDIIIVERKNEDSVFRRLPLEKLRQWIDDYSLGELWEMNLLEGRPENE